MNLDLITLWQQGRDRSLLSGTPFITDWDLFSIMHRVGNYNFVFPCRPSSGHILEALHVDPASGVSLEKDKIVKLPKPSVRYGHDYMYQVYFGGICLIL